MGGLFIKEHIQQDPDEALLEDNSYVIVSNHVSFIDIFYIYWRFAPSFLSKVWLCRPEISLSI